MFIFCLFVLFCLVLLVNKINVRSCVSPTATTRQTPVGFKKKKNLAFKKNLALELPRNIVCGVFFFFFFFFFKYIFCLFYFFNLEHCLCYLFFHSGFVSLQKRMNYANVPCNFTLIAFF